MTTRNENGVIFVVPEKQKNNSKIQIKTHIRNIDDDSIVGEYESDYCADPNEPSAKLIAMQEEKKPIKNLNRIKELADKNQKGAKKPPNT
jgi:hypothetical protein